MRDVYYNRSELRVYGRINKTIEYSMEGDGRTDTLNARSGKEGP
ncbi:MAG: hypothetical protein ACFFCC_15940 [Promethearchaeota archaeon]